MGAWFWFVFAVVTCFNVAVYVASGYNVRRNEELLKRCEEHLSDARTYLGKSS